MAVLHILTGGEDRSVTVPAGTRLSEALRLAGTPVEAPCGGAGRCGKCRVMARGQLSAPSGDERTCLPPEDMARGIRLACRTLVLGDAEVRLAPREAAGPIRISGVEQAVSGTPVFTVLGAAVDIGTTTLAARLFDPAGQAAAAAAPNPQRSFGADVITRIGRAMEGDGPALAQTVRQAVGDLLRKMCAQADRSPAELDALVVTGNTAMLHLLTGEDPSPLAAAPFAVRELFGKTVPAGELELPCGPGVPVYLPRCMSAFVGADIAAALLASGICRSTDCAMLADIGTNGEIALWQQGRLLCCSTAAGPAFEGASLSQGMQGAPGAIDHAWLEDGGLRLHTIGGAAARGICGSGVADVLACLLKAGRLDETGLLEDGTVSLTEAVAFTQQDVRQVQLAKSAVRAGMETLLRRGGTGWDAIRRLEIAGGFGSYLDLHSAGAIGLIPPEMAARSRVLGNAALSGAAMLLHSRKLRQDCEDLAKSAETVELAADPAFMELYIDHMLF